MGVISEKYLEERGDDPCPECGHKIKRHQKDESGRYVCIVIRQGSRELCGCELLTASAAQIGLGL